ncbi:RE2 [Symbiodinium natans]|uniref:RE2 protein n=1 Tax=Symbiodinium natans TaxID=878477 RepID=A0A812RFS6_9DINO|nr:RE2 [Symbiodinium natans]
MFDAQAARYLEQHENDEAPLTDEALEVHVLTEEGVAALDQTATAGRVTFSRKLHYLLANLTSESALLVVRQNYDSNGFETWRRLVKKFALPDAARHVSLLTQLLDFRFGSHTFEQDFNTWETIKTKYERQTGADLPDSVLVATLLNKTSGALQQHLRLNARTLTTYEDIKATIVEYYQSRHLIMSNSSSSNQGPAPMDIGGHVSANCPLGRVSAVDENATLDGSFEDWSVDDTWQVGDFEEEWWSDDLVAAVGLGWSDEEWWPAWDDGWSSTWSDWNDDTWSVVSPPPAVEKATSAPPSHAAEPKATSGAPVSAVTLGTPPARLSSAAKPKATPKATSKASGLAIAAITLGSMFAGTQSCFVSPTCDASLDCMLSGSIVFDGFGRSLGARSDVATWQLSPVCDLPLKNEANQTSLSNPTSLSDWGLEHLSSTFYDPYLAEHEVAVASVETGLETWILFDSGAAANCCPPDFAPDFPLLKLEERAPPLKSISGQTLQIYGRKLVAFELDGQRLWLNFYVCDVPYSVISVARLLQQGCKAVLTSEGSQLEGPTGATFPVTRHGSLLFLCPTLAEFDPNEYADFSKGFHEQFAVRPPPGLVAPTLKPTYYHADSWVLDEANATLTRLHKRGRATLFSPEGTKDRPVELKDLTGERVTVMNFEDGSSKTLNDDWRKSDDPRAKQDKYFKGKTVFKLASKPTGRRLVGKQSTLPRPEVHVEMPPPVPSSRTSTQKLSPEVVLRDHGEYADTFRKRVFDLVADEAVDPMKGLENFVKRSLDDVDPQTNEAYTHDTWVQLPTMWIRLHRQPRKNLFVPSERSEGGPNLSELSKARVTIQLDDHGSMKVDEDDWTLEGADRDVVEPFACGGATCFEKRDLYVKEIPEVAEPDLFETSARRPRGLPAPSEPTLTERKEHELTHLPFRSWCPICVRAKSKQNHSRTLKTKQPVVQLDYCFLGDNPEEPQVTLLTAVDLLSGMGLSCVVPAKGRSVYAQAELRRYILEIGRTFGILQIDPEPSLKALVAEFTSEVVHFRKIGKFPKSDAAWEEGLWLGRDTESNQHFVGTPQGVIKIRSLRRRPPSEQLDLALVQSLTATPWDPRGTKVETDHFVFPPQQPRPGENLVEPPDDPDAIPENLGNAGDLAQELEQDMLRELQSTSETRTAADLPVPEGPMDAEELAERQDKRSHEEPTSSAERASSEPATSRRRVGVTTERKRDTSEVPEAATKVQRISSLVRSPDQQMRIFDLRISAVTTKQELEVPVCVNQDETEISLAERLSNPLFWQSPEFTYEEEKAGMNKEMKSMIDFDVFTEQKMSDLTPEQLATVISTKWVKVRKGDGTCRCRLVVRGYDQLIDDPDDTYASTPSLLTLKTLLTLAAQGFQCMKSDPNLYFHAGRKVYVLCYVDDLMLFGAKKDVDAIVASLQKELLLRITGELVEGSEATFLGRKMRRTPTSVEMYMSATYVEGMLAEAGMSTCKPAPSPGTDALKKVSETAEALNPEEHKRYRKLVGQLLWMCNLRMDIMYAVKELSRGLASPTTDHWAKLKHLLRYLAGTKEYVQELRPNIRLSEKAAQNWRLVQPTFPAGETLLGLRDLAIEEAQHWTLEMHQRAFVQDTYASFSTFSNFWRHEVFMSILFSGLQKERLTIRQLLLIPRDPRTNFLLVVPLLFVLFPGLYHPGSRQYPGLYHSVHGPPLYFTFELQWITSLAIEMLGVHLFSPQEINFMPWTCYIVLPRSTWARLMQRLVTQRVLVITPADLVWTSGMLNVGFSLRSTLLFTIFNFQFHPGRAEYQESFVALGFSISGQTFGAMMSSGGNIWNRRYRDYFIKLPLLQLFHPAEIATLVSFTCTNQALTFARLGEMYHNFIQAETHLWLGHIPLHKAWLRPGEAELGDDETVDPHLVRRMMQYDLHRPKL